MMFGTTEPIYKLIYQAPGPVNSDPAHGHTAQADPRVLCNPTPNACGAGVQISRCLERHRRVGQLGERATYDTNNYMT